MQAVTRSYLGYKLPKSSNNRSIPLELLSCKEFEDAVARFTVGLCGNPSAKVAVGILDAAEAATM